MTPRGETSMVPPPEFESYYGRQIIKTPTWKTPDVPLYLFLGGMGGASAVLAEVAASSGRPDLERVARVTAAGSAALGTVALVHDLGRPDRFLNMLRVLKPTSPLSVGSFILAPFASLSGAAAASFLTGRLPRLGRLAGVGAAALGPPLATYTGALLANTAVPAWHEARHHLPFVFVGSAATAAAGLGLLTAPTSETGPVRRAAVGGAAVELAASSAMEHGTGLAGETFHDGTAGRLLRAAKACTAVGAAGAAVLGGRSRFAAGLSGLALLAGSALTRFGIFAAGQASTRDPKYTVVPQRERLAEKGGVEGAGLPARRSTG